MDMQRTSPRRRSTFAADGSIGRCKGCAAAERTRNGPGTRLAPLRVVKVLARVLSRSLDAAGALGGWLRFQAVAGRTWLPALAYHRIHDRPEDQPFDRGVIDATPRELARQLEIALRYFTPVGVTDLLEHVEKGRPLPRRPILFTFDDGYRECVTHALPVLRQFGVKASFFVSTRFVAERRVFWWDRMSFVLRSTQKRRLRLAYPARVELELDVDPERQLRQLLLVAKSTFDLDFDRFLGELTDEADVPWSRLDDERHARGLVMTWDDLRELRDAGMEVHSHTRSHRILQNVTPDEIDDELSGSRRELERELGTEVRAISYPVGRPIAEFPHIVERVAAAGYGLGFSSGIQRDRAACHRWDIGRILMDREMGPSRFRALLAHPWFASTQSRRCGRRESEDGTDAAARSPAESELQH